ncbi:MAG: hypothetical protein M1820_008328 [Bogoriella megaspora]|nr:MAG: hypothetical protein M1820_008328 [Bogoriella megaspora]
MPGIIETPAPPAPPTSTGPGFSVHSQRVEFDIDFSAQTLKGKTDITLQPHSKDLKIIKLHCRQCKLTRLNVEGKPPSSDYQDPYRKATVPRDFTALQHHWVQEKIEPALGDRPEEELSITLPRSVRIDELDPLSTAAQRILLARSSVGTKKSSGDAGAEVPETPSMLKPPVGGDSEARFTPLRIHAEFEITSFRDGLHFVGMKKDDTRYPHVYTRNNGYSGVASCIFPCLDDNLGRCSWEIVVRCPRTLGDAFKPLKPLMNGINGHTKTNGILANGIHAEADDVDNQASFGPSLTESEKAMELSVICSGDLTDEILDPLDETRKTVHFRCKKDVAPRHIGFAIGPFEHVNLSEFREEDDDEKLGQNAFRVHGFCLPGRSADLGNTCFPLAKAIDFFTTQYGAFPFGSYKVCFVDDLASDVADTAGLSLCSNRLLFPEDILEPINQVTRTLIHGLASQWIGVNVISKEPEDMWAIVGISYFMANVFLKKLMGNNEYRFHQKLAADKVYELDILRPSLHQIGPILDLDPSEMEFMALKAPLVLFILDRRLTKASTTVGMNRIINKLCLQAMTGDLENGALDTVYLMRQCERIGRMKLETFFQQWVYGSGCPHFSITQKFNKKKQVVEMLIVQAQINRPHVRSIQPHSFMRQVEEGDKQVEVEHIAPIFTGPMTIRIHEADGTPYEHIVEIKDASTKFDIPYNTKYKRLKRSKRQKERAAAASGINPNDDTQDDVLLYCLGDVLQSDEEIADWRLTDWSKSDEDKMSGEFFEWMRIDSDFEWICKLQLNMPHYMFVSQLQQDRDVVAQMESIQYLASQNGHPILSSILTRTLMDRRYFYGVRVAAAQVLAKNARDELNWIGLFHLEKAFQEFYCLPGSPMTQSNDFSDRTSYIIQCAIPKAIANVRDNSGRSPMRAKRFFIDKLKFNDNSNNMFSDVHYVSTLLSCLTETLIQRRDPGSFDFSFEEDEDAEEAFKRDALNQIERYGRIDEEISSFQNVYSVTAIDCLQRLMQHDIIPRKVAEILQYTRFGNADGLRLKAFSALIELGLLRTPNVAQYIFYSLATDMSPRIRSELFRLIGIGLGMIATEERKSENSDQQQMDGGLIIEQEASTEVRAAEIARRQNVPDAIIALRKEIENEEVLQKALWHAVTSPQITLTEMGRLLDLCRMLYEPVSSRVVVLKYPRYWKAQHLGEAKMRFWNKKGTVRTTPLPPRISPSQERKQDMPAPATRAGSPHAPRSQQASRRSSAMGPPAPPPRTTSISLTNHAARKSGSPPVPPPAAVPMPVPVPVPTPPSVQTPPSAPYSGKVTILKIGKRAASLAAQREASSRSPAPVQTHTPPPPPPPPAGSFAPLPSNSPAGFRTFSMPAPAASDFRSITPDTNGNNVAADFRPMADPDEPPQPSFSDFRPVSTDADDSSEPMIGVTSTTTVAQGPGYGAGDAEFPAVKQERRTPSKAPERNGNGKRRRADEEGEEHGKSVKKSRTPESKVKAGEGERPPLKKKTTFKLKLKTGAAKSSGA